VGYLTLTPLKSYGTRESRRFVYTQRIRQATTMAPLLEQVTQGFDAFSHFSNQVTISDVERCYETSQDATKRCSATVLTHLDECGLTADAIQCLSQRLVVLADILVLEGVSISRPPQSKRSAINTGRTLKNASALVRSPSFAKPPYVLYKGSMRHSSVQREIDRQVDGRHDTYLDDGLHRKCRLEARLDLRQITETQ